MDKHNLTFELEHDAELIADDFKLSTALVEEMMVFMVNLRLFENSNGIITCIKMASRTDEYTQKLINKNKSVPTLSAQKPKKSVLREENRREQKRTIPENFIISESVKAWAKEKGYCNLESHYENFKDACLSKGYQYIDWDRAFMTAIRKDWAGVNDKNAEDQYKGAI